MYIRSDVVGRSCVLAIFLAAVLLFSACAREKTSTEEGGEFFRGVDDMGTEIVLYKKPQRIVSLNLGTDEILLALAPPEQIAALSAYVDDAGLSCMAQAAKAVRVKLHDKSPERVLAQQPDIVFTTDSVPKELVDSMRDLGLTVFVSKTPKRIAAIIPRIESIGKVIGREKEAAALTQKLHERLADVARLTSDIKENEQPIVVAFAFSGVFGRRDDLFDDMCRCAALRNGAAIAGLTKDNGISMEQIVALDPDVFLLPTWSAAGENTEEFRDKLRNDPLFKHVKAVRENRLYCVPDTYRYSASHIAIEAVYVLAKTVYPERFLDEEVRLQQQDEKGL